MCKTWSLSYTCKHLYTTRLSTCHGTFTVQPKAGKPLKPACSSAPTLVFQTAEACGECQRKEAEQELDASLAKARLEAGILWSDTSSAEQTYRDGFYKLEKTFPGCRRYSSSARSGKAQVGVRRTRGSLLSQEILPEQVVLKYQEHRTTIGWAWDQYTWGDDYKKLSDELAEKGEEETPSLDLPMTGRYSMDEYLTAFEPGDDLEDKEDEEQSEQQGDLLWSMPWSCELEESPAWKPEETTYWSSASHQEENTAPTVSLEALTMTPEAHKKDQSVDQLEKTREQTSGAACPAPFLHQPTASTRTLPNRNKTPTLDRRPNFDGGKMEIELRDRFKCLRFLHLISVGGD